MATEKEQLVEEAKALGINTEGLTVAKLKEAIADESASEEEDVIVGEAELAEIEVVEEEEVVEKKVYEGKIDVSLLDESAVNAIAYYRNGGVEGKERLESIVRNCIVVE